VMNVIGGVKCVVAIGRELKQVALYALAAICGCSGAQPRLSLSRTPSMSARRRRRGGEEGEGQAERKREVSVWGVVRANEKFPNS